MTLIHEHLCVRCGVTLSNCRCSSGFSKQPTVPHIPTVTPPPPPPCAIAEELKKIREILERMHAASRPMNPITGGR